MDNCCLKKTDISLDSLGDLKGTDGQYTMGASISQDQEPHKYFKTTISYQHPKKWQGVCQDWTSSTNLSKYNKSKLPKNLKLDVIEGFGPSKNIEGFSVRDLSPDIDKKDFLEKGTFLLLVALLICCLLN